MRQASLLTRRTPLATCLAAAALLAAAAPASAQGLPYEPRRRLVLEADLPLPGAEALEARLRGLELAQGFRYQLAVVRSPVAASLPRYALELRARWAQHPEFDADRTFVIVCAAEPAPARVALAAPRALIDRLALSLPRVERTLLEPFRPRQDLAAALIELVTKADKRVAELESQRVAERMRRTSLWEQLDEAVDKDLEIVSERLTGLELRCVELRALGLDVAAQEEQLQALRHQVALALEHRGASPEPLIDALRATSAALADIEARLARLDDARHDAQDRYGRALNALTAYDLAVRGLPEGTPPREAARRAWDDAAAALREAGLQLEQGRPEAAARQLDLAERELEHARRALQPPPVVTPPPTPVLPWLALVAGVIAATAGAVLLRASLVRGQLRAQVDGLREVTARLSQALAAELGALRTLHLQASRPAVVDVPPALLTAGAPPAAPPRAYADATAAHLARARGRLEDLHDTWRQLEQALARSDAVRRGPGGLAAALDVLERAPSRKLPVGAIREVAQRLERVAGAPAACGRRLAEAAAAVAAADALLERVLAAGLGPQPFEDDVADVRERAHEAALAAQRDPVGAALLAGEACAAQRRLEDRVERALELARGLGSLRARLEALPAAPAVPRREDLPALAAWAQHLGDEVAQALDEGARDEATRELDRALGLVKDCELLTKGAAEHPSAELQLLRDDLRQGLEALGELRRGFARPTWDDVEVALVRAAARLELLALALGRGERVPRLSARLNGVRTATLLATTRLLQARAERERAEGLLEELDARARAIASYLEREAHAVSEATRRGLAAAREGLEAARRARGAPAPRWDELAVELAWLSDGLDRVRERAGREARRATRAQVLRLALERGLRDADDVVRRLGPESVGARACLAAAREVQAEALAALDAGALDEAIARFQRGLRSCREAREMAAPRAVRSTLSPGPEGDAAFAVLLLRHALGRAQRAAVVGLASDPAEVREQLARAEALAAADPAGAAQVACAGLLRADALVAAALQRERLALEAQDDARHAEARELALARRARERAQRDAERHRRTRFEVLVLGEEEQAAAADAEDIDAAVDDPDELAALDEVAPSEVGSIADEAPDDDEAEADAPGVDEADAPANAGARGVELAPAAAAGSETDAAGSEASGAEIGASAAEDDEAAAVVADDGAGAAERSGVAGEAPRDGGVET